MRILIYSILFNQSYYRKHKVILWFSKIHFIKRMKILYYNYIKTTARLANEIINTVRYARMF